MPTPPVKLKRLSNSRRSPPGRKAPSVTAHGSLRATLKMPFIGPSSTAAKRFPSSSMLRSAMATTAPFRPLSAGAAATVSIPPLARSSWRGMNIGRLCGVEASKPGSG
jgi:hypothetical protein